MSWELALQSLLCGLSTIGTWFLYQLITEYKDFKKETASDLVSLRAERRNFEVMMMASSLKLDEHRQGTEHSMKTINHELKVFRDTMYQVSKQAERSEEFMKKTFTLAESINKTMRDHDKAIKTIQVRMGEVTIFKTPK